MLWIVKYWILRKDYDTEAQIYLTKKSLQQSDRTWDVHFLFLIEPCLRIKDFSFVEKALDLGEQDKVYRPETTLMALITQGKQSREVQYGCEVYAAEQYQNRLSYFFITKYSLFAYFVNIFSQYVLKSFI